MQRLAALRQGDTAEVDATRLAPLNQPASQCRGVIIVI